ncbi:MAG: hypothetical protein F9K51_08185 [Candidatus Dadabacteria bacterium]|nr:MAG: hypothetical protein F9K51_08185 [Candidatus Dadabacteria bacterium]
MPVKVKIKKSYFQDALRLMRISKSAAEIEGVKKATAVMATDKAKFALETAGLLTPEINGAGGGDLVMVVEADSEDAADSALSEMETAVTASSSKTGKGRDILGQEMRVINIGLEIFKEALDAQGMKTIQVDWEVPAKGDEKVLEILKKMY